MKYFTSTNLTRQALITEILSNPKGFIANQLTWTQQQIFKQMFSACQNYEKNYISQEEIARRVGCTRQTVNETFSLFRKLGILASITRHRNTCEYSMNEFFFTPSVRKVLSSLYKYFIPIALSSVFSIPAQDHYPTPLSLMLRVYKTSSSPSLVVRESYKQARYAREANPKIVSKIMKSSLKLAEIKQKLPTLAHGDIQLAVFPDEAIDFAMNQINMVYKATSPFGYFVSLCKKYCSDNGIAVNWRDYYLQKQALNLDNDAPTLDQTRLDEIKKEIKDQKPETNNTSTRTRNQDKKRHEVIDNCPEDTKRRLRESAEKHTAKFKEDQLKRDAYFSKQESMEQAKADSSVYVFCLECEMGLHKNIMINPNKYTALGKLPNPPRWEMLSKDEQIQIISMVHINCTCRDYEKEQLGILISSSVNSFKSEKAVLGLNDIPDKIISQPKPVIVMEEVY